MASSYYGTTGQDVIKLQQELNKLGAGLKVDGVWGKLTEAAYQQYAPQLNVVNETTGGSIGSLLGTGGNTSGGGNFMSDEYIKKLAESQADTNYQSDLLGAKQQAESQQQLLEQAKNRLAPQYDEQKQALGDSYAKANQAISDAALARGMGRSSYLIDREAESHQNQVNDESKLMAAYQASISDYNSQIDLLTKHLMDTQGQLSQKKQNDILSAINSLTGERDKQQAALKKYQDDQDYRNAKLQLEQNKLDQNYQLQMLKMGLSAKKSSSGGSSGKSSKKSSSGGGSGVTTKSIMNDWNSLTDAGKLKYISDNKAKIAKYDVNLYNKLKKQADNISKKGSITAAPTKYYNYYKDQTPYSLYSSGR